MSEVRPPKPVQPPFPTVEQLPHELTELTHWIAWLYDWRGGPDWAKQPFDPKTGKWKGWQTAITTFEDACKGALEFHGSGVGFKPLPADPYIFVDFDDCLKDGVLDPVVAMWIGELGGYSEVTPSGGGMRSVVKGRLPRTVTNTKLPGSYTASIELYAGDSGRYLTVTGKHFGEPHLEIPESQDAIDRILKTIGSDMKKAPRNTADDENDDKPKTLEQIRAIYEKHLEKFSGMKLATDPQNDQLNICALIAARGFLAGAFEKTEDELKSELRAIAESSGHCPGIDRTLDSGWDSGIDKGPFRIFDPQKGHDEALNRIDAWLSDNDAPNPDKENCYADLGQLTQEEYEERRKPVAARLKIRVSVLDGFVNKRRQAAKPLASVAVSTNTTADQIRKLLSNLLLTTQDERASLGYPEGIEKASELAEDFLWQYIKQNAQVFCTASGLGYLLFHVQKEMPIPITHDGKELSAFLSNLGIHPGAAARNRIGKFIGNQCWREGMRVEPHITFHYEPKTYTGYFAEAPGKLIKITAAEITQVDNGADGQLFLLPDTFETWTLDLENLPPPTNLNPDAFALLPDLLFEVLEFENESLCREDIEVLLGAYIATLYLPGIVVGKLLLQILGESGSGKTLFLRMLGRLIYGQQFQVTGLDTKPDQFENAIVNNSFLALDDVKRTTDPVILGMIRRACTGGTAKRRELYSTFGQVEEPFRAAIALTCSEEPFTGSDEMSNRALVIRAKGRDEYIDEHQLLQRIDANRDALIAEMMVRLQSVIIAIRAQANFKPRVKLRMASFATFLLRVGRQFDWGVSAQSVLDCWLEEQQGGGLDDSIVETLTLWLNEPGRDASKRYSASELYREMMKTREHSGLPRPWWFDKDASLVRSMRNSFHAYQRHFGFCFSTRSSGHKPPAYWFDPGKKAVAEPTKPSETQAEQADIPF